MTTISLPHRIVALERVLTEVPHAFGGALALAYYAEPEAAAAVARDGQARVMWDRVPIGLFFAYDPFHDAAGAARRTVPFAETPISILAAEHLVVCKVIFDRPRDWVDIDAMLATGLLLDAAEILRWVGRIAGDVDPRYERITALLTRRMT